MEDYRLELLKQDMRNQGCDTQGINYMITWAIETGELEKYLTTYNK